MSIHPEVAAIPAQIEGTVTSLRPMRSSSSVRVVLNRRITVIAPMGASEFFAGLRVRVTPATAPAAVKAKIQVEPRPHAVPCIRTNLPRRHHYRATSRDEEERGVLLASRLEGIVRGIARR